MKVQSLRCARCSQDIAPPAEGSFAAGYGFNDRGQKICYSCCGEIDREDMMRFGEIVLYLSKFDDKEWEALKVIGKGLSKSHRYKLSNWPGTLIIQPFHVHTSKGRGFGGTYPIEHVAFVGPDGYEWYGRCAGHSSQLTRCRRKKKQSLSFGGVVWTTQDGRKLPLWQLEPQHLENIIRKIVRDAGGSSSQRQWSKLHQPYIEPLQKILDIKRRRGDPERNYMVGLEEPKDDVLAQEVTQ
jgi:hypothetical protein